MKPSNKQWQEIGPRVNLAGVQYSDYQLIFKGLKPGTVVSLVGEPYNPIDPRAIRVEYKGIKLGYVPQDRFGSHYQSELWNAHANKRKCIGIITAFNKTNPTWCMITVQFKARINSNRKRKDIPL